jgi:hypothetical protein
MGSAGEEVADASDVRAQPKLLRISGRIDGSGRIVFTRDSARYEHKHWGRPSRLLFDGEPWARPERTPAAWRGIARGLDLTRAWIVARSGRDVIALENTPDGFDLYLCDSPNGAAEYSITLAIPRRG